MAVARWICLLYSVLMVAAKVQWDAPTSTRPHVGQFDHLQTPKPTIGPVYRHPHGLMKRALSDQLCGYISGVSITDSQLTCGTSYTCTTHSTIPVLGCCVGTDDCDFGTTCLDSTACDRACLASHGSSTIVCSDSLLPYCATFVDENFSVLICSSGSTTSRQQFAMKSLTEPPSSTPSEVSISTGTTSSSSSSSVATNAGAIAGGVVGGLAVLVSGAIGCFFIMRRSRANNAAAATDGQQYVCQPPPSQQQPGVGYYPTDKPGLQQQAPMPVPPNVPTYDNYAPQYQQQHYAPQPIQPVQQQPVQPGLELVNYDQRGY